MLSWLANAWRVPELRRRVLFTAFILAVYRFGSWIPSPGVDASAIQGLFDGGVLGLLSLFSGGALSRFSIFALGIMPYVTASIVIQLLTVAVPKLEQLKREGESGQAKITQYTRYFTVVHRRRAGRRVRLPLPPQRRPQARHGPPGADRRHAHRRHDAADVDGRADHQARHRQRHLAADLRLDPHLGAGRASTPGPTARPVEKLFFPIVALGVVVSVVFVQEGQRRIPIQYAKRMVGRRQTTGGSTYMPLRVNMAGVIPVIFAATLLALPQTVGSFVPEHAELHQPALLALVVDVPRRRGAPDRRLHVLLHRRAVQPGRPGRRAAQVRRLHPGHPARPADRDLPRPRADAPDTSGLALPGDRRACSRPSSSTSSTSRRRPRAPSEAPPC